MKDREGHIVKTNDATVDFIHNVFDTSDSFGKETMLRKIRIEYQFDHPLPRLISHRTEIHRDPTIGPNLHNHIVPPTILASPTVFVNKMC